MRHEHPPIWVKAAIIVLAFALAAYWFATFSGPYRWLAEAALSTIGRFPIFVAVAVVLIGTMGAGGIVIEFTAKFWPASSAAEGGDPPRLRRGPVAAAALGIAAALGGSWFAIEAYGIRTPAELDIRTLESGNEPSGAFVEVSGSILVNKRVTALDPSSSFTRKHHYVPVVSKWGTPVRLFVAVPEDDLTEFRERASEGRVVGMLGGSMPSAGAKEWKARGLVLAEPHWILDPTANPGRTLMFSVLVGLAGLVTSLVALRALLRARGTVSR